MTVRIHPSRPIADAIPFDDLERFDTDDRNFLASRGVVFCTSFKAGGRTYGGNIIAPSMAHAEEIAFGRGLNEEIVGVMVETGIDP